jgi:hypothetical protein
MQERCRNRVPKADVRLVISTTEHPATVFIWSWIELGTQRESLLQVLHENANFGGRPAAGRPYCKNWQCSLKGSQKTDDGPFSEFCGEEPGWRLGNPQMFKNTHPHLFNIAGSNVPKTFAGMAKNAEAFIDGLGLTRVDLLGFSPHASPLHELL